MTKFKLFKFSEKPDGSSSSNPLPPVPQDEVDRADKDASAADTAHGAPAAEATRQPSRSSLRNAADSLPSAGDSSTEKIITSVIGGYSTAADTATTLYGNLQTAQDVAGKVSSGLTQIVGTNIDFLQTVHDGVKTLAAQSSAVDHLLKAVSSIMQIGSSVPFIAPIFTVLDYLVKMEQKVHQTDAKCEDLVERVAFLADLVVNLATVTLAAQVLTVTTRIETTLKICVVLIKTYREQGPIVRRINIGNAAKFSDLAVAIKERTTDLTTVLSVEQYIRDKLDNTRIPVDEKDAKARRFFEQPGRRQIAPGDRSPKELESFAAAIGEDITNSNNLAGLNTSLESLIENSRRQLFDDFKGLIDQSLEKALLEKDRLEVQREKAPMLECVQCGTIYQEWMQADVATDGLTKDGHCSFHVLPYNSQLHPISPSISRNKFDVTPFGVGGDLIGDLVEDPNEDLCTTKTASSRATSAGRQGGSPTPSGSPACRHGLPRFPDDVITYGCVDNDAGPDSHDNGDRDSDREDERGIENVDIRERMPDVDEVDLRNGVKSVIKFKKEDHFTFFGSVLQIQHKTNNPDFVDVLYNQLYTRFNTPLAEREQQGFVEEAGTTILWEQLSPLSEHLSAHLLSAYGKRMFVLSFLQPDSLIISFWRPYVVKGRRSLAGWRR
ncbi:hypothetical protein BDZ88DRAFT_430013, partial [Geranomyces variabilis]